MVVVGYMDGVVPTGTASANERLANLAGGLFRCLDLLETFFSENNPQSTAAPKSAPTGDRIVDLLDILENRQALLEKRLSEAALSIGRFC